MNHQRRALRRPDGVAPLSAGDDHVETVLYTGGSKGPGSVRGGGGSGSTIPCWQRGRAVEDELGLGRGSGADGPSMVFFSFAGVLGRRGGTTLYLFFWAAEKPGPRSRDCSSLCRRWPSRGAQGTQGNRVRGRFTVEGWGFVGISGSGYVSM